MLLHCCSSHLSHESAWQRRHPPCPVCQSCVQTVSGFCSTGRWRASESCWTKSGGLYWRSPNIQRLCPGTSGGVTGGSRSHCHSICRQWWSQPAWEMWTKCQEGSWKTGLGFIQLQVRLASKISVVIVELCCRFGQIWSINTLKALFVNAEPFHKLQICIHLFFRSFKID